MATGDPVLAGTNPTLSGVVIGPAGGGIDFSAATNAGSVSEVLDNYAEGTWTPADVSGASLALTSSGTYTRIGDFVKASFVVTYPVTADASQNYISLPFNSNGGGGMFVTYTNYGSPICGYVDGANNRFVVTDFAAGALTNANLSGKRIDGVLIYRAA